MDSAGEQFLARSRFAQQQHVSVGAGHVCRFLQGKSKNLALPNDFLMAQLVADFLTQIDVFFLQAVFELPDFLDGFLQLSFRPFPAQ